LEETYEECLCRELDLRGIPYKRQLYLSIEYKGHRIENAFRLDLLVGDLVIVDLKSIERFHPIHEAQILTYLRLTNLWLGLVLNFNVPVLKDGILRRVRGGLPNNPHPKAEIMNTVEKSAETNRVEAK
jgi:GxxExxY protein